MKSQIDQSKIISSILGGWIAKIFVKKINRGLPPLIANYHLVEEITKVGTVHDFKLGLYQNEKKEQAIAKMWCGTYKNHPYYTLNNEIVVYEIFHQILTRLGTKIPDKFSNISIPKLLYSGKTKDTLLILLEKVPGEIGVHISPKKRVDIYMKCVEYMRFLGFQMTYQERLRLSVRSSVSYILIYPLLLAKAVASHPRAIKKLINGISVFIRAIPILLSQNQMFLVHRDLHINNILISANKVFLIDFQLALFSIGISEYSTTLRYLWKEDDFCIELLKELRRQNKGEKNFEVLLRGMIVHAATHGLTGRNFTREVINKWIDFLSLSQKKYFYHVYNNI